MRLGALGTDPCPFSLSDVGLRRRAQAQLRNWESPLHAPRAQCTAEDTELRGLPSPAPLPSPGVALPVYAQSSQVPIRGAKVWPGLVTRATIPKSSAEAACFLRFRTRSSSTKSVTTRLSNLQVPSVNTRLLQNNRQSTE